MKLLNVTIYKYKSFITSQSVKIEDRVTRLVGKNESGKTAFLEALSKYNYFDNKDPRFVFDKIQDYPRNELKDYEQDNKNNDHQVLICTFEINNELLKEIETSVGKNTFSQKTITISKGYNGSYIYHDIQINFDSFCSFFLDKFTIQTEVKGKLREAKTLIELYTLILGYGDLVDVSTNLKKYMDSASEWKNDDYIKGYIIKNYINPSIPAFWYFDEYYSLPAQISLTKYKNKTIDASFMKEQYDISNALFALSGIDVDKLLKDSNHEAFIAELEATSNSITDKFLEYWSTNKNLEIVFEIQQQGSDKLLNIRIKNTKHRVTLPLKNRSKGFIWFFSFLVWFSRIENQKNVIILLDEPGLNLHAEAQNDLLRYIDEKLSPNYQVVYTTHSPFMVDSSKLHEVRTVYESNDMKTGSIISDALDEKDKATLFLLQAALGYDIAQNLYISQKNLLVEGVSDLVFLTLISEKIMFSLENHFLMTI